MSPSKILIVEDDRIVARDLQQQLIRIGHSIVGTTARGDEALQLSLELKPSLVLMDIRLEGETDGIDAAKQIRERCGIPIVYLTAYTDDQTLKRAGITEPFGYLLKPFENSQLRTTIEMALYKHAAEQKLRESERRYAVTLSSIGDAVIATDEKLQVTFMNPVAEALTGWSSKEAAGASLVDVFQIINEDTRQVVDNPALKVLRSGIVVGLANHTVLISRDGREIPIDDCGSPIINDHGEITGAVLVFRDITARRQTDATLRRAQAEVAAIGQRTMIGELAAAIAHELNQPLTGVISNTDTALRLLSLNPTDLEEVRIISRQALVDAKRAADVIARIRSLFMKNGNRNEAFDLHGAIQEILTLKRNEIQNTGVAVRHELAGGLPPVVGDRLQLQQAMVNLITNALQAMNAVENRPRELILRTEAVGAAEVQVTFRDTGIGFESSKPDRLFEAFYTTKSDGMGMGLWISRSIIEKHGGRLWAAANDGPGATVRFTLPLSS